MTERDPQRFNLPLPSPLSTIIGQELPALAEQVFLPEAYHLPPGYQRSMIALSHPKVVFIEVTNRCNLLCETCVRTFLDREPLKSLTYQGFVFIAEQFPEMRRAVLHGIGEPLLNKELPEIIAYLKGRGVEVIINSNGTLLSPQWQQHLVESGLDEYRCSIDGSKPETYARLRGADLLHKIHAGLDGLVKTKARLDAYLPRISIWCVVSQENLVELPELVRAAARLGVPEVYVQRMTFFANEPSQQYGMARADLAIFGSEIERQEEIFSTCERLGIEFGVDFRASGARDPRSSLEAAQPADQHPWQDCLRPWTTAYITANGNCLPCCISPFSTHDYGSLVLGNLFEKPFAEIWNEALYRQFRTAFLSPNPHKACAGCGVYWSL